MKKAVHRFLLVAPLAAAVGCVSHADEPAPLPAGEAWLTQQQFEQNHLQVRPVGNTEVGATVVASGRVTFDDLRVSHIMSPVTGRIVQINADLGARVRKGQTLALIESPDVGMASSDMDKARADLLAAQRDLKRQQSLFEAHAAAQRDYENAEDAYDRAQAEYDRAVKKSKLLRDADDVSQGYQLRSQIDGEVVARQANPGVEIQGQYGGNGTELFTIGNLESVWVMADIYEPDLGRISRGQQVSITVPAYPHESFTGTVDYIASVLDPTTRTAKIRCVIANADRKLKPEMLATVRILASGHPALTVGKDSVVRMGDKTVVFVQSADAQDGHMRFVRRPVIVDDAEENGRLAVMHGLSAGEVVVEQGADRLAEMI